MQIELTRHFDQMGSEFAIDFIFDPKDQVHVQSADADNIDVKENHYKRTRPRTDSYNSSASKSTNHCSSDDGSANGVDEVVPLHFLPVLTESKYSQVMHERWHRSNAVIPRIDQQDILEENPIFNRGSKSRPEHQQHPEFT